MVRIVLGVVGGFVVVAAGVAYWAADEYLIDHVEVADVAAYEAEVTGDTAGAMQHERVVVAADRDFGPVDLQVALTM